MLNTDSTQGQAPVDWAALACALGCLRDDSSESCSTPRASHALDVLVGDAAIREAVDLIVDDGPGRLLAEYVLAQMMSPQATTMAYEIYRTDPQRAGRAAYLILRIGHPEAAQYIPTFLADEDGSITLTGMDLLDCLLQDWTEAWLTPEFIEQILTRASEHPLQCVRVRAAASRVLVSDDLSERERDTHYLALVEQSNALTATELYGHPRELYDVPAGSDYEISGLPSPPDQQ